MKKQDIIEVYDRCVNIENIARTYHKKDKEKSKSIGYKACSIKQAKELVSGILIEHWNRSVVNRGQCL
jgi:F0F1-type ATP synthase assembly protein I